MGSPVYHAMMLVSGPAIAMIVLALAVMIADPPVLFVAAMQHLAAGIVLSAVAVELVPEISEAENNSANNLAIVVGFVLGVGLFLFVGKFCEAPEDDEEGEGGHGHDHSHEDQPKLVRKRSSKIGQMKKSASHGASIQQQARTYSTLESASSPSLSAPPYPTTLVLAVCVDAMVDGFLIGISAASGTNAGIIMAIALTVEMAFLSLTFAASLRPQSKPVFYVSVLMPPLALWLGGFIGATTATAVAAAPALHVGLISFGIAALLFLVTEELLLEAHEAQEHHGGEEHIWWVDACFFGGFLAAFLLDKLL
mmetsp:Transcript_250/g.766  ORF Transcript_250/g.766 Transcript_250/m.766 type:complete len:309 (-) Transcript_250:148-1074(-)